MESPDLGGTPRTEQHAGNGRVTRAVQGGPRILMTRASGQPGLEATEENIHVKIVSHAVRVAIAGGLAAGSVAIAAPDSADAVVTTVGTCTGTRGIGSAKSTFLWPGDGKAAGITDKNHDVAVSTKGTHALNAAPLTIGGSCTFTQAVATGALTTTPAGTKSLLKWSSKVTSPVSDCAGDTDSTEWPLNGKLSFAFTDLTKMDAYVATANPTGSPADTVSLVGIVTKGVAVGSQVANNVGYTPVLKDKTIITDWDGTEMVTEILVGGTAAERAVIQGYAVDPAALGCQVVVEPAIEATNIRYVVIQDGTTPILLSAVTGGTLTIGAP